MIRRLIDSRDATELFTEMLLFHPSDSDLEKANTYIADRRCLAAMFSSTLTWMSVFPMQHLMVWMVAADLSLNMVFR
jgi:hypothetical protein